MGVGVGVGVAVGVALGVGVGVIPIEGIVGVGDSDGTLGDTVGVGGVVGNANGVRVGVGELLTLPVICRAICRFSPS